MSARFEGQQAPVFVIGMRYRVQHARGGVQPKKSFLQSRAPEVLRQRFDHAERRLLGRRLCVNGHQGSEQKDG
jgi:hypothetical protein